MPRWSEAPAVQGAPRWASAPVDQSVPKIRETELRQGQPESAWHSAWSSVRDAIFGTPERQELKAAGDLEGVVQPTPAEMAGAIALGASMVGGGPAGLATAERFIPGAMGRVLSGVGRAAKAHPRMTDAAIGAAPGLVHGDFKTAAEGAAVGALVGGRRGQAAETAAPSATQAARTLTKTEATAEIGALLKAGKDAEARAMIEGLRSGAVKIADDVAPVAAAQPAKAAVVDKGRQAASQHAQLMAFGKEVAARSPKVGERIWILLDEAGSPIRQLTPDQAGAAARKGLKTTWVRNLWR